MIGPKQRGNTFVILLAFTVTVSAITAFAMIAILNLLVGLGIFLYGMHQLESGAKDLSGSRLKSWIARSTRSPLSSALSGTLLTAFLQSSSLVGLVVLAFASAGAIPLFNAIGVLLGANLGTTFTGWIVTLLGFKLDLEQLALPIIAASGLSQILFRSPTRPYAIGRLFLGVGLLLLGLSLMKSSVADVPQAFSFDSLQGYPPLAYLLLGTLITALIQSSSAMMILTLTALNAGLVSLPEAAALVIGADLGTTSTVLLGSLTGGTVKKQLALAHLLFNVVVDLAAFFLFLPLLPVAITLVEFKDPLYALVAFHSFFNLVGLCAFIPVLKVYSRLIVKLVKAPPEQAKPLRNIPIAVPEAAMPLLDQALMGLWFHALRTNAKHFAIAADQLSMHAAAEKSWRSSISNHNSFQEQYAYLKQSEGEILKFIAKAQQLPLSSVQTEDLNKVTEIARAIVYSCKTLKDIQENLSALSDHDEHTQNQFQQQREYHRQLYTQVMGLLHGQYTPDYLMEECESLSVKNDQFQRAMDERIYQAAGRDNTEASMLSTQLNVNREVHHAAKNLLNGLKMWTDLHQRQA